MLNFSFWPITLGRLEQRQGLLPSPTGRISNAAAALRKLRFIIYSNNETSIIAQIFKCLGNTCKPKNKLLINMDTFVWY